MKRKVIAYFFNNISLRNKLILCFLTLSIASMSFMAYYVIYSSSIFMIEQANDNTLTSALQLKENLENKLRNYVRVSEVFYNDQYLQETLTQDTYSDIDMLKFYQNYINPNVTRYSINSDFNRISIYTGSSHLLKDGSFIVDEDVIKNTDYYKEAVASAGRISWSGIYKNSSKENVFFMTRLLNLAREYKPAGVFLIEIPDRFIYSLFNKEAADKVIYVINPQGNIISSTNIDDIGRDISDTEFHDVINMGNHSIFIRYIGGKSLNMIVENISGTGSSKSWKLLYAVPIDNMLTNINRM